MTGPAAEPGVPPRAVPRLAALATALLLGAAFLALRVWGLDFGRPPIQAHPDERHYAAIAQRLAWDDLNPHYFENPPLLTHGLFVAGELHAAIVGEEAHERWVQSGGPYRLARWISAVLGTLTALAVGAAAWTLLGGAVAGFAAAMVVGFSFLHGRDSHYGVNDVPMVALVSVSLLLAASWLRGGRGWLLWGSAVLAGLAAATKYNGAIALSLPVAAVWMRRDVGATWPGRLAGSAGLAALAGAAFVAANPYCLLSPAEFLEGFRSQLSGWGDAEIWGVSRSAGPLRYLVATLDMLGWVHTGAALAGTWLLLGRAPRTALFLLACPALYLAGMLTKELFFWRFALPLLPFLALLAAVAWTDVARRVAALIVRAPAGPVASAVVAALLLALGSAEPAAKLARHDQLLTRDSTWMQARAWLLDNLPQGAWLLVEGYPPRFPPGRFRLGLPHVGIDGAADAAAASAAGGWLVLDSFHEQGWQHEPEGAPWSGIYAELRATLLLVAEFPPGPHGDPQPFVLDSLYSPLVDLWAVDRPGCTISVYRMDSAAWQRLRGR